MLHSGCVALVKPFAITHPAVEIWHFCFLMMLAIRHIIEFIHVTEEGFLISPCCSLELHIQVGMSLLFSFACHFSSFLSYL